MRLAAGLLIAALATTASADVVRILDDPRDAVQARADVIRQATTSVDLLYFLARDDRITLAVLELLRDARRRGVGDVRVIIDGSFHRIPKAVLAQLRDEGIEIRVYHPLDLRHPSWMFRRMHEKVIVADGARYIAGGRNLAEAYFGMAERTNFVDRDVYIDGPSAADAQRHFDELWSSAHVAEMRLRVSEKEKARAATRLAGALSELACAGMVRLDAPPRDWSAEGATDAGPVRFLYDRVGDGVIDALAAAQESILIESPYFIPSRPIRDVLQKKLADGVRVQVVTNSLRSTDGLLPQAAYLKYRRSLARAGVDFREYKGPDTLHAKSIVVDGRVALIGSYNIDPRSQYLNTEIMCVAEDEAVARALSEAIDAHAANAWTIHPAAPVSSSLRVWAARVLLLPLIENQL